MSSTPISIATSRPDQCDLRQHREHASAGADLMQALGLDLDQQVIVRRDADRFAMYTLTDAGPEPSPDTVRMGRDGRGRLAGEDEEQFAGFLDSLAVDPAATEEQARSGEKLLELLDDDGLQRGLLVLAPHGGAIEPFTDDQAEHVTRLLGDLGVSCWRCKGWRPGGGAAARWHITSTEISPVSFPQLATIAARGFRHAVSFHGFTDDTRPDILVGGAAPDPIKSLIRAVVVSAVAGTGLSVDITGTGDRLGGAEEANLVNRLTTDHSHGIQIEQQHRARTGTIPGSGQPRWQAVAAAIADSYRMILTE
jgi:phage replication-related protein YjqB (UPF0714/DUF867 family)